MLLLDITPPPKLVGRIAFVNVAKSRCAIDLRPRDGVEIGRRFRVVREGGVISAIEVTEIQAWGCWVRPVGDVPSARFRKGDRLALPR